ncbi:MAG: family 20 glycosylhydrolase [Candidatus Hydrogenedentes bacterium]|nr:family 20 glycosylhydrolase [Candidatus Hydrogenedentota bacterium]
MMIRKWLATVVALMLALQLAGCVTGPRRKQLREKPPKETLMKLDTEETTLLPSDWVLLPAPREIEFGERLCVLPETGTIHVRGVGESDTEYLRAAVRKAFAASAHEYRVIFGDVSDPSDIFALLSADPTRVKRVQGYEFSISAKGVHVVAHDAPGLFYAAATLGQLARQCPTPGRLPVVKIEDWPDFPNRGVMLDIARDKIPEMETLYALVDKLADWKCNQLQLYMEHSFAYRDHPLVWQDASPMTTTQFRALDAYCRARCVELVPNQNSFGHMERWLRHEPYKQLAEVEGGSDLCPTNPGSIALLSNMYADLLPNFSSRQVNVGCDETWSLGKGRSKDAVRERGVGRVYLDFLLQIHRVVKGHGRTMQFWGDIIMHHPELIPELPQGVIAMEWGYEANHPFADHGQKFAQSKIPFYVVPGTSSWNSLLGRTDNAVGNLRNAAENGLANGAIGYLVTDWGDGGHWQFLPVSYLGYAYGAGVSWAVDANKDMNIPRVLDVYAFQDSAGVMGHLAYDLGNAYQQTGVLLGNSTLYYRLLQHQVEGKTDNGGPKGMTKENLTKTLAYLDQATDKLPLAEITRPDAELIVREFRMGAAMASFACRLGLARLDAGGVGTSEIPAAIRHSLAAELEPLLPEFRQLWLARNRSGGLKDSAGRLENLMVTLKGQ